MGGILCRAESGHYSLGTDYGIRNRRAARFASTDGQAHSPNGHKTGFVDVGTLTTIVGSGSPASKKELGAGDVITYMDAEDIR